MYGFNAIESIDVYRSRKIAADTACITMTNVYSNLTTRRTDVDYNDRQLKWWDNYLWNEIPQDLIDKKENEVHKNIYLEPGARIHLRMGYSGNASDLPVVFNGTITEMNIGDVIDVVNGHDICQKYIPRRNVRRGHVSDGNKTRKKKVDVAPLFAEHADTEQLAYNLAAFKPNDEIEITLKMHGTSQRTGYLPVLKGYKRTLIDHILRREGKPMYEYGYVSGTRRVVLEDFDGGYYGSNEFREQHSKFFEGKLWKGETIYYEVVGFTQTGAPIMASADNKKLNDKEFTKQYGKTTTFSYGCEPTGKKTLYGHDDEGAFSIEESVPQSDMYVYRMTMTNEDGNVVEYTPDFMRYRCEQMGVKTVPVFWHGYIPENLKTEDFFETDGGDFDDWIYAENAGEWAKNKAEQFYDGTDPI
jgi:hypothetical protein